MMLECTAHACRERLLREGGREREREREGERGSEGERERGREGGKERRIDPTLMIALPNP